MVPEGNRTTAIAYAPSGSTARVACSSAERVTPVTVTTRGAPLPTVAATARPRAATSTAQAA